MLKTKTRYERPKVQTLSADRIVELMGPVSCGSGGNLHPLPNQDGITGQGAFGRSGLQG